jgi:hypothetical protein
MWGGKDGTIRQPCAPEIRSYGLYAESERAARGAAQDLSPGGQEQALSLRDARGQGAEGAGRLALGDGTRRLLLESENRGNTVVTVQRHRQRQRAATRRAWPCVAWGVCIRRIRYRFLAVIYNLSPHSCNSRTRALGNSTTRRGPCEPFPAPKLEISYVQPRPSSPRCHLSRR